MTIRKSQYALVYLRRSGNRQENSLRAQLGWALGEAARLGVKLDAEFVDLEWMQLQKLSQYKGIFLDDAISGADMLRPGFVALMECCRNNSGLTHVFVFKRDRLARPEEAMEMANLERQIRYSGVTIVMSQKSLPPLERGRPGVGDDLEAYIEYHESAEFLRKLGERVTGVHQMLAREGYRTGGDPPYGFVRVLVDAAGRELEELPKGKTVRQPGCHVRIKPKDEAKLKTWIYILDLKLRGWGNKRIADHLTALGIPSPRAGQVRTDRGKKHTIGAKWNPRTIAELSENAAILGLQEYGNRGEGKFFRHDKDGPRRVGDRDRHQEGASKGRLKLAKNDPSIVIRAQAGFDPLYDSEKWQQIREQTRRRGDKQRGVPRVREPGKYPLSCRIVDLTDGCGSILYGRANGDRRLYVCGRYMKTSGIECENNSVDAEAMLRVTVETLSQLLQFGGAEAKLKARLMKLAQRQPDTAAVDKRHFELSHLENRRTELERDLATAKRRMAVEQNDIVATAYAETFQELTAELADIAERLETVQRATTQDIAPEQEVEQALTLHQRMESIQSDSGRRAELLEAFETLGVRIGLNFGAVQKKKRVTRRLLGGVMVFDDANLPVPLHGELSVERKHGADITGVGEEAVLESPGESEGGVPAEEAELRPLGTIKGRQEGVSFTFSSRGDRI